VRITALVGSLVIAATTVVGGPLASAGAADGSVTVHGLRFPLGSPVQLSFVGCDGLYSRAPETLAPRISTDADLGQRSVAYDLAGGNAVGTLAYVDSLAATTHVGLDVKAPGGTTGVAYAVYQPAAMRGTATLWVGRASLTAAGGWTPVDALGRSFAWERVDSRTGTPLGGAASATVADFTAEHGDGAGFVTAGFGCDGQPFQIDALRLDGTVDDLEGFDAQVGITASADAVSAGGRVTLTGSLTDGFGGRIPQGTLILEASTRGGGWSPVAVVDASGGDPQVEVSPTETTRYRFRFADRDLAPGSESGTVTVTVAAPSTSPAVTSPPPSSPPSSPTTAPDTPTPSGSAPGSPAASPSPSTTTPEKSPTTPSQKPTSTPTGSTTPSSPAASPTAAATTRSPGGPSSPSSPAAGVAGAPDDAAAGPAGG